MKKIYVIILFLIFFNLFTFMLAWLDVFPYAYGTGNPSYNITDGENISSQVVAENATGFSYDNILRIFLGDLSTAGGILATIAFYGAGVVAAWLTRSAAPFVVVFIGNIMKNTYVTNMDVFNQFPVNTYFMAAVGIGMIILFVVTCAEVLTHGHGEV